MNKKIEFLALDSSPEVVEATQGCHVIIHDVEPDTEWSITVVGTNGEQVRIDFIGGRPNDR